MADSKISSLAAAASAAAANELEINEAGTSKKVTAAQLKTFISDVVYVPTTANTAVNVTSDATIATRAVTGVAAGDQVIVDAWFTILNDSTATRVYVITLDFDALFDIEISTGACATSATLMHPFRVTGVCDVRSTSLAYAEVVVEGQLAAGIASGTDTTISSRV